MKKIIAFLCFMTSTMAVAKEVTLKVDLSQHADIISSARIKLTYFAKSEERGCRSYSGNILEPHAPEKYTDSIPMHDLQVNEVIRTTLSKCQAKLYDISILVKHDRKAMAEKYGTQRSEVARGTELRFYPLEGEYPRPLCKVSKYYVDGSDHPKFTLACMNEVAEIKNGVIDLRL